jgi:hypothetical protein
MIDKNRRCIGESQSKRPPERTQQTPHREPGQQPHDRVEHEPPPADIAHLSVAADCARQQKAPAPVEQRGRRQVRRWVALARQMHQGLKLSRLVVVAAVAALGVLAEAPEHERHRGVPQVTDGRQEEVQFCQIEACALIVWEKVRS